MRSPTVGTAALLGVAAFVLYVATLSRHPSADSLFFALAVESGDPRALLNVRHPLLHPLAWAFVQLWQLLGWQERALLPLQVLNALGGGAAVALVHHIAARLTASPGIAAAVGAGFAVSGAVWLLSTEAEFVTVPLAAGLLLLNVLLAARPQDWEQPAYVVAVGTAVGTATLCYLSNASLGAVAIAAAHPGTAAGLRVWARRAALLIAGALLVLVPAIALLAQFDVSHEQVRWMLVQLPGDKGYVGPSWIDLPHAAYAFARSLMLYPDLGMNDSTAAYLAAATSAQRAAFTAYYAFAAALALSVPLLAISRRTALWRAYRRPALLLALWALLHAAFALAWVVGDCSFWVPVLAAWWLLVALLLATAPAPRRALQAVAVAAAVLLVANGLLFILPRHDLQRNRRHRIAAEVADRTSPNDIVVTRGDDLLVPYLRYFAQRPVIGAAPADVARAAATALERAQASGGRVFVVGLPPLAQRTVVGRSDVAGEPMWEVRVPERPPGP